MSKHIELAKKIKALVDQGVDGEKISASTLLEKLIQKHNITLEDIEGEYVMDYFFNFPKSDHTLWYQIVKCVNFNIKCYGEFPAKVMKSHSLKGNHMITCTPSEYIEIEAKFNFYKKLYESEAKIFFDAFLKANNLLITIPNRPDREMTKEDYELWKRTHEMAQKIKVGEFNKQITD